MRKGKVGEIAACSPLAPAATEDSVRLTFFLSLCLLWVTPVGLIWEQFHLGAINTAVSSASGAAAPASLGGRLIPFEIGCNCHSRPSPSLLEGVGKK